MSSMLRIGKGAFVALLALAAALSFAAAPTASGAELPNILWITCEDICPNLGCFGDRYAQTPNIDRLAERGLRFRTVWSNAPVCAPARTTIISGVYRILNREAQPLEELGTMMDLIVSRSKAGRRRRGPSALLRGTAEWASRLTHRESAS